MFNLFEPTSFIGKAPRWAKKIPQYPFVFGTSAFADLFVCSADRTLLAVISTERPELIELKIAGIEDFRNNFLQAESVRKDFFREADFNTLSGRLGTMGNEECFYPVPYPSLGGSGSLDTYQRGDVWVHLDLYGQSIGL